MSSITPINTIRKRGMNSDSFLYVLMSPDGYKVGITVDPDKRLAQYNTLHPTANFLFCEKVQDCAKEREAILLQMFENFRVTHQTKQKNESEVIMNVLPIDQLIEIMKWVLQIEDPKKLLEVSANCPPALLWIKLHKHVHDTSTNYYLRCKSAEKCNTELQHELSRLNSDCNFSKRKIAVIQNMYDDVEKQLKKHKAIPQKIKDILSEFDEDKKLPHESSETTANPSDKPTETIEVSTPVSVPVPSYYTSRTHTKEIIKLYNKISNEEQIYCPSVTDAWTDQQWITACIGFYELVGESKFNELCTQRSQRNYLRDKKYQEKKRSVKSPE
jgi:hypothetical protein